MKAILVDDEPLQLKYLKIILENKFDDIEVVGAYSNPLEAERMIRKLRPALVFLDIEMPNLNGLQLAERIQETCSEIDIVFVTAFDKYAVQAFELYAIDYIMKPIQLERLKVTMERLGTKRKYYLKESTKETNKSLSCFQTISVKYRDHSKEVLKWRTAKAQELFAYLLHHCGRVVYRDTLLELLWPDFDPSKGAKQLYTMIYHIRKTLKEYGLEEVTISRVPLESGYRLDVGSLEIDTVQWCNQVVDAQLTEDEAIEGIEKLFQTYEGDYLGEHDYLWAEGERERLRNLFLSYAEQLHKYYMKRKMMEQVIRVNEYVKKYNSIEEISYFNLMKVYASMEKNSAVHDQYQQLKMMMDTKLDAFPSEEIRSWYAQWKNPPR